MLNGRGLELGQVTWGRGITERKRVKAAERGAVGLEVRPPQTDAWELGSGRWWQGVRVGTRGTQGAESGALTGQRWGGQTRCGEGKEELPRPREASATWCEGECRTFTKEWEGSIKGPRQTQPRGLARGQWR